MEEFIEITAEKVFNSLDGFSLTDQALILLGIIEKLNKMHIKCLKEEYGLMDETV